MGILKLVLSILLKSLCVSILACPPADSLCDLHLPRVGELGLLLPGSASTMLSKDVDDLRKSQTIEGPGSSSLQGHMAYGGSRHHSSRWEYSEKNGCGFAELSPIFALMPGECFKLLEQVKRCDSGSVGIYLYLKYSRYTRHGARLCQQSIRVCAYTVQSHEGSKPPIHSYGYA